MELPKNEQFAYIKEMFPNIPDAIINEQLQGYVHHRLIKFHDSLLKFYNAFEKSGFQLLVRLTILLTTFCRFRNILHRHRRRKLTERYLNIIKKGKKNVLNYDVITFSICRRKR